MQPGLASEVMPFVRFDTLEYGRNEQASQEAGRHIPMVADFVFIHPHGSKDCREYLATEWLKKKRQEAINGGYPKQWIDHFDSQYKEWKEGRELPRQGTPVKTWGQLTPEQITRCRALGYTVVEDLAALPDGSLSQLGLDGRVIRDMARAWINEGKDKGANTRLIGEQTARLEDQQKQIDQLLATVEALKAQIGEKRGPGRPRKETYEAE